MSTATPDRELPSAEIGELSSLGIARARRRLTVEDVAERASLSLEAVDALEQSRLYRFSSVQEAVAAVVLYSTALGISRREARHLAGLPAGDRHFAPFPLSRLLAPLAFATAVALLAWFVIAPRFGSDAASDGGRVLLPAPELTPSLPERANIEVDVLNGSRTGRAATRVADRIAGLSYGIGEVDNAARNDYPETRVYFTPGSLGIAQRLAEELGVTTQELPGGDEPGRLVVIVGAEAPLD